MKRFLSLLLCAVITVGGLCFPAVAADDTAGETLSFYEDASPVQAAENAAVSYDANQRAIRIAAEAEGSVRVQVDLGAVSAAGADGQLHLILWAPATNQGTGDLHLACADWSETGTAVPSHRYELYTFDGATGEELTLSFDGAAGDSVYLYAAGGSTNDLSVTWDAALEAANGHTFTEEELFLDAYEVERYTEEYWDTDAGIVYNESFFVLENEDGTIDPISLMYDIDRVISVQDSFLEREYIYGVDYTIEDGKLVILPEGGISPYKYSYVYRDATTSSGWWETTDGSYVYGGQYPMYMTGYLNITYTYTPPQNTPLIPEPKGHLLNNTLTKLESGDSVKILTVGDSIAGGANCSSSSDVNAEPYADIWHEMAAKKLQLLYPEATVEYESIYQGGATAALCIERMDEILKAAPDLIIIEFGVNDCMQEDPASLYVETLQEAIAAIRENLPGCDIILMSPLVSNPLIFPTEWFDAYADALYPLEEEGVAVADVTSMMGDLLTRKRYLDMTGDNLCHPNDFVSRLFAQILVATISRGEGTQEYIADTANRLLHYRYESRYYPEQWEEVQALMEEGAAAILACGTEADAAAALMEYREKINEIPTKKQVDADAVLDSTQLVFDTNRAMDAVPTPTMAYKRYDAKEQALVATVSSPRNPIVYFDYTAEGQTINADDYTHLVLTMKAQTNRTGVYSTVRYQMQGMESGAYLEDITVPLTLDGRYHSYIVDLTGLSGWTGSIQQLALKLFNTSAVNDEMYISSVILCSSAQEAQDTALERERIANKESAPAITGLFDSEQAASALQTSVAYMQGDVNGDGSTNALDALELAKYLAGVDADYAAVWRMDVNGDENVNAQDALELRKLLAGLYDGEVYTIDTAGVAYNADQDAAEITALTADPVLEIDVSALGCSADVYKYVTLCLKAGDAQPLDATVTVTTDTGSASGDISFGADTMFQANSCGLSDISGTVQSVSITFHTAADSVIYLDSYVFTASADAAKNAEIVRVGAANLI